MSPHASDPDPFEIAHIVARFAGEEGHDHPRQKVTRWLGDHHEDKVGAFNEAYALRYRGYNSPHAAVLGALSDVLGDDITTRRIYLDVCCSAADLATKYSAAPLAALATP